jgi:hypothetical protein
LSAIVEPNRDRGPAFVGRTFGGEPGSSWLNFLMNDPTGIMMDHNDAARQILGGGSV